MEKLLLNKREVQIKGERNVLELARREGIDIPTFCYHSELSVYGACRMCLVDIEGMGIVTSCSIAPKAGMKIRTNTARIRKIRKINLELLLAGHERECTTCGKSGSCTLQDLARKMNISSIRFSTSKEKKPLDLSSLSLMRDPNKCVLCGDCVRMCDEIQSVGAIDFAFRGAGASVYPAFGKNLSESDCVNCGQCARVCPTGAIIPRSEIEEVWEYIEDPEVVTAVQVAPAIRSSLGEHFSMEPGALTTGKMISALRRLGFDKVYDTCFAADMTVLEEGEEFLRRLKKEENLPLMTSCCPAWVEFAEKYYPEMLENLSSCRSPQQIFGSLARKILPEKLNKPKEKIRIVSIMPCTAKKSEARRPEFKENGRRDVDNVLTTQELARMIEASGLRFSDLEESHFDMPFGLTSGAGILFGASGGVTEAVVRYLYEKIVGEPFNELELRREEQNEKSPLKEYSIKMGEEEINIAVVQGLGAARELLRKIRSEEASYHMIEVMACPGGCVNGAGQPVTLGYEKVGSRKKGLRAADRSAPVRAAQNNPALSAAYRESIGDIGGELAHSLFHTSYRKKKYVSEALEESVGYRE